MNRNDEILSLSQEILVDITDGRVPLHNALLKASRLSLLVDLPANVPLFQGWASNAEQSQFILDAYKENIAAAKDSDSFISSANPSQFVAHNYGNGIERDKIRREAENRSQVLAKYRAKTYDFVLSIYNKSAFGHVAQSIFEKKRARAEQTLQQVYPDTSKTLNSIEQNLRSANPEDWKNAVVSCRTLLMDIADIVAPATEPSEKDKYINRLKSFVSPKIESQTKKKLVHTHLEELKKRIEYTSNITQAAAHQGRPLQKEAEDIVLYTYLIIAEIMEIYASRQPDAKLPVSQELTDGPVLSAAPKAKTTED